MADLSLSVQLTRTVLGLSNLDINDHTNYYVAPGTFGASKNWLRTQAESVFVDGKVTTHRVLDMVTEPLVVEVNGSSAAVLYTNLSTLLAAVSQDNFQIVFSVSGQSTTWQCEASDIRSMTFDGPRLIARRVQMVIDILRQPNPVSGIY